jgi:hypothetical protein
MGRRPDFPRPGVTARNRVEGKNAILIAFDDLEMASELRF